MKLKNFFKRHSEKPVSLKDLFLQLINVIETNQLFLSRFKPNKKREYKIVSYSIG